MIREASGGTARTPRRGSPKRSYDWRSPGLTDTESEATLVVLGRKSECHVHIRLSSVDGRSSWPG